jgi:hypothetical protein
MDVSSRQNDCIAVMKIGVDAIKYGTEWAGGEIS